MPITKTKAGRFYYQFDRYINGRRCRANKLLPAGWTEKQAQDYDKNQTARLYALATGQKIDALIDDAVLAYVTEKCPNLKTGEATEKQLEHTRKHYTGKRISELPQVAASIYKLKVSPATKRNYIAVIRSACRYGWKVHQMGESDPAQRLVLPKVKNERHVYATRLEMLTICKKADKRIKPFIRIAFYSGMRMGEILKAKVIGNYFVLDDTKNGEPRIVPIHSRIKSASEKYLPPAIAKTTLQKYWQLARDKAELNHIHFHDLRHSAASEMINQDIPLNTVGDVLGHKDPRSTKRYAHLLNMKLAEAINKIGRNAVNK